MKLPKNPTEAQILAVVGLVIKSIYTRGTVAVQTLDLDSQGRLVGIFLGDGVRFRYTINNGILSYAPVNPKDLPSEEGISLSEDALEFARLKLAGNTKQEKKCNVGYPCGFTCISQSKVCNKALPHQAKNAAEWAKKQRIKSPRHTGMEKIVNEDTGEDTGYTYDPNLIEIRDGYRVTCRECSRWITTSSLESLIKHSTYCASEPQPVPPPPTPKPKPVKRKDRLAKIAEAHRKGANVDPDEIYEAYRAGYLSESEAMNSDF